MVVVFSIAVRARFSGRDEDDGIAVSLVDLREAIELELTQLTREMLLHTVFLLTVYGVVLCSIVFLVKVEQTMFDCLKTYELIKLNY